MQKLVELMQALVQHGRGRYAVAPTLMRGPLDILAALRGAAQLPLDLIDQPEHAATALDGCAEIWAEAARGNMRGFRDSREGYVAGDAALHAGRRSECSGCRRTPCRCFRRGSIGSMFCR